MTLKNHPKLHPDLVKSGDRLALEAASAFIKAITTPEWPFSKLQANGRMTLRTLMALQTHANLLEVREFLADLLEHNYRVNSRQWHYFKYKYEYNDPLINPTELDERFVAVIADPQAGVYVKTGRYVVYSAQEERLAVVALDGKRITVYRPDLADIAALGDPVWIIQHQIA